MWYPMSSRYLHSTHFHVRICRYLCVQAVRCHPYLSSRLSFSNRPLTFIVYLMTFSSPRVSPGPAKNSVQADLSQASITCMGSSTKPNLPTQRGITHMPNDAAREK